MTSPASLKHPSEEESEAAQNWGEVWKVGETGLRPGGHRVRSLDQQEKRFLSGINKSCRKVWRHFGIGDKHSGKFFCSTMVSKGVEGPELTPIIELQQTFALLFTRTTILTLTKRFTFQP